MNGDPNDPRRYDDIIDRPHPAPRTRARMARENRAAQFSPFAALVGYDAAIRETARLTGERIELDDDDKILLNGKLQLLRDNLRQRPEAAVTYFRPDARKDGGAYVVAAGVVKKVDEPGRELVMAGGERIPIDDVIAIEGELFDAIAAQGEERGQR